VFGDAAQFVFQAARLMVLDDRDDLCAQGDEGFPMGGEHDPLGSRASAASPMRRSRGAGASVTRRLDSRLKDTFGTDDRANVWPTGCR
jgi:hypothetical protein